MGLTISSLRVVLTYGLAIVIVYNILGGIGEAFGEVVRIPDHEVVRLRFSVREEYVRREIVRTLRLRV